MAAYSDIAIIFNPGSTGNAPGNARELQKQLKTALPRMPVTLLPTKYAKHAEELAFDFAKKHRSPLIISASGDGGYNEVINGALRAVAAGAKPVCAVLPSGNANDHARTVQQKPLLDLILQAKITKLDVLRVTMRHDTGSVQERYAHSYAGIGLTPKVGLELNKNKLNTFEEARIVLKTLWRLKPVRIRYGRKVMAVDSLICSLIPEMAKIITLSHTAKTQDGLFKVTLTRHRHKAILLLHLIRGAVLHLGKAQRTTEVAFTLLQPSLIQMDGEVMELPKNAEVTVAARPRLLRTLAVA